MLQEAESANLCVSVTVSLPKPYTTPNVPCYVRHEIYGKRSYPDPERFYRIYPHVTVTLG